MRRPIFLLILGLTGCAQLPHDLPARPTLKTPEAAVTMATLTESIAQTGKSDASRHWWQTFGLAELDQLIDTALKGNPDIDAVQARLWQAAQAERLVRLDTLVHYSTDATLVREHLSENGLFPPPIGGSSFTQTDITENLSYNLDWWGKNRALVSAAGNERQAAQDQAEAVRLTVAAAVADAYFAWVDVHTQLTLARELEQCHRQENTLLKARLDLGLDSAQPLIDARKRLDLDEDRIQQFEYRDQALRFRLSALIGSDPDHTADLPSPNLDARIPPLPVTLPLGWLAMRPDIAALRSQIEAAADQSTATKADFYPNLDLRMMVGLETLDLAKLFRAGSISASAGPALHLPIFNTNTLRAKLGMREADYAAAVAAYNSAILEAARQTADSYALIASLERRSQAQQKALNETRQTLVLAEQRRKLGLAGPIDTLEASSAVLTQRMNDIETQTARLRAHVALYKALGGDSTTKDQTP
jgi:NodT family efflux transporter outer membrane factor (OMF) lipoprotein